MIIAVDFDGTLCTGRWPDIGAPKRGVIDYCKSAKRNGAKLILNTARTGDQLRDAVAWCEAQGLHFDAVNENLPEIIAKYGGDTRKIVANQYIDDLALRPDQLGTASCVVDLEGYAYCSACGIYESALRLFRYCPHCGAYLCGGG